MKKYIRSSNVDHAEDSRYQQLFADVVDHIIDHITANGAIQAHEMAQLVPGYDPDWCAEEDSPFDNKYKEIMRLSRQLARLLAEDYFANYGVDFNDPMRR